MVCTIRTNDAGGTREHSGLGNGFVSGKWAIMWPIYYSAALTVHGA